MKRFNWLQFLVYIIVAAGLLYLTKSFAMSLGIFMLLLLVDQFLAAYDRRHRSNKDDDF